MTNSNLAFLAKSDCKDSIMSDVKPEPVPPPYACETIKPYNNDNMQVHYGNMACQVSKREV